MSPRRFTGLHVHCKPFNQTVETPLSISYDLFSNLNLDSSSGTKGYIKKISFRTTSAIHGRKSLTSCVKQSATPGVILDSVIEALERKHEDLLSLVNTPSISKRELVFDFFYAT